MWVQKQPATQQHTLLYVFILKNARGSACPDVGLFCRWGEVMQPCVHNLKSSYQFKAWGGGGVSMERSKAAMILKYTNINDNCIG